MIPTIEQLTAVTINVIYLIFMMANPTWPIVAGYFILSAITAGLYYLNHKSVANETNLSNQMTQLSEVVAKEMTAAQTGRLQIRDRLTELETKIADIEELKTELSNIRMSMRR